MARHRRPVPADHAEARARLAYRDAGQTRHRTTGGCNERSKSMKTPAFNTTVLFYPNKNPKLRLFALWYFMILMIVWNILGQTYLGFEQSWATPFVGVGSAIALQLLLEWVDATARNREL